MNPGREGTGLQVLFWEPLSIWSWSHSCQQKFRNISPTIFFEGAPLRLTFISHTVFHIILLYVIFSGFITVLNSFTGILVLFLKHLLLTTNKSGAYWDLVGCWTLQDETPLFPIMGCGFQNTSYGNCLPLPPTIHHLKSSLTASAFSTQTVSAYCCLCLHFLLWKGWDPSKSHLNCFICNDCKKFSVTWNGTEQPGAQPEK